MIVAASATIRGAMPFSPMLGAADDCAMANSAPPSADTKPEIANTVTVVPVELTPPSHAVSRLPPTM